MLEEQKPLVIKPEQKMRPFSNMTSYPGSSKEPKRSSSGLTSYTQAAKSEKVTPQRAVTSSKFLLFIIY